MKTEDMILSKWIVLFQWLPVEDTGQRFLEWLEDVESKLAIVECRGERKEIKTKNIIGSGRTRN